MSKETLVGLFPSTNQQVSFYIKLQLSEILQVMLEYCCFNEYPTYVYQALSVAYQSFNLFAHKLILISEVRGDYFKESFNGELVHIFLLHKVWDTNIYRQIRSSREKNGKQNTEYLGEKLFQQNGKIWETRINKVRRIFSYDEPSG